MTLIISIFLATKECEWRRASCRNNGDVGHGSAYICPCSWCCHCSPHNSHRPGIVSCHFWTTHLFHVSIKAVDNFLVLGNMASILSFFAWIFASGNVWPTGMEEGVGTLTSQLQQQPSFPKFFLSPWHLLSVLSKAMRGRSARAGPDLVGCWSTSWTSATHQQCLPTFSSHSSTCWSGQLSWNQRQSWTTLKFLHRWAPTSQLLNRLEASSSISLDEEKQWFVT